MRLPQGGVPPWPDDAVHDSVAAIARQAMYQRAVGQTLMKQLLAWIGRLINEVAALFRGSGAGRAITIAGIVLLAVLVIARFIVSTVAAREHRSRAAGFRGMTAHASDPWGDAERLAIAGRFTEAAHAVFAALLLAFAARGEVRLHGSKTTGDYARELRRRGAAGESGFRAFRARYDRIIYGVGECSEEEYAALLRDARPLLTRAS